MEHILEKFKVLRNKALDEFVLKVKSCVTYQDQENLPNFLTMIIRKYNKEWNEFFKDDPSVSVNGFQYLFARQIIDMDFPENIKNSVWYLLPKEERS